MDLPARDPEVLLEYDGYVRALAAALVSERHRADDVTQETWMAALEHGPRDPRSLRAWLAALVRNFASKLESHERRRVVREHAVARAEAIPSTDEILAREAARRSVVQAVVELEEPYRSAVLLRYFEHRPPREIARMLSVPVETVRTRIKRALEQLREKLDQEHGHRGAWMPVLGLLSQLPPSLSVPAGIAAWASLAEPARSTLGAVVMSIQSKLAIAALAIACASLLLWQLAWSPSSGAPARISPPSDEAFADTTPGAAGQIRNARRLESAESAQREAETATAEGAGARDGGADVEPTGDLLVRVVWPDGATAPGVRIYLCAGEAPSRPLAEQVSDASGEVRAKVSTGKVTVRCDRGGRCESEVVADQTCEVELKVPDGVDVEGVVRDSTGAPVPGARIWLTAFQVPWCAGAFVAEADANGTFALRAVPSTQSLGAIAEGFAPSDLVDLELLDRTQPPVRVELLLAAAGGALAGRVIDEQGKEVAGAVVAVGTLDRGRTFTDRKGNTIQELWAPRRAVTGEDGRYEIAGLAPGAKQVEVWADAFPFWHGAATIELNWTAQLDVTLSRPVTVFGRVTGEDGKPLAGACVRCFPRAIEAPYLQGGQYDYDSFFGYPFAITDSEGRYRLWRAAPPELHLYASARGKPGQPFCWAHEVVRAEAGALVEWNAVVEPGLSIRGVVRYRDGVPMDDVFVSLTDPGSGNRQTLVNDSEGRFRFVRLEKKAYDLYVQVWDAPPGSPQVEAREVWPDGGEIELVAAYDAPKKQQPGSVRGTIVDAASRLANPAALEVILATDRGSWRTQANLQGSSFHFKDVDPGRVRVIAMSGEDPVLYGPWIDLQPGEQRDVGALVTEPGGKLVVRVVRFPGTESLEPDLFVTPVGGSHARKVVVQPGAAEVVLDNLIPGEQRLSAHGQGIASIRDERCTVVAGSSAVATLELRAAVAREIVVEYESAQTISSIRLQDERGRNVFDIAKPGGAIERPYRIQWLQLPLGKFTLFVETAGGGKAETTFEMTSLEENQSPVVLRAK